LNGPSRSTSIVFQDHGLFPWQTVRANVEFNMKARSIAKAERRTRAEEMLALTGLSSFATRYPHELSGGMRQRVGIARALTTRPRALLMDEPFGALDAQTRGRLQSELLDIWAAQRTTVLFVTHSIDEAVFLADRILVFTPRPGRLSADVTVDLPRPRDPRSDGFAEVARGLRDALGNDGGSE
jgi:NitT/TauT family transport system ATP-binding protein